MQAVALRRSRLISTKDRTTRQKPYVGKAPHKDKLIRFIVNGDRFCKGIVVAVTHKRYRLFDSLLAELSNLLSRNRHLPSGVQSLFSTDGRKISQLDELEDGKSYICSGDNNVLKKFDYATLNNAKTFRSLPKRQSTQTVFSSLCKQLNIINESKIIFVVKSGTKPRKITKMLLNKQNSPSFEHVLTSISETVKLVTGAVRKVFGSSGNQITQLEQFFELDDLFFVYGLERVSPGGLKLDFEETKILKSLKNGKKAISNKMQAENDWLYCRYKNGSRVPKQISSRYTIGDRLGDGNFSVVYRCFDKQNNTERALKVIKKNEGPRSNQMIKNEIAILKSTNHPNIIKLISEFVTPTRIYLVTELVSGGDLFEAITRSTTPVSNRDIRFITKNLASALAYLHGMNIVHRDVKPENLLVEFTDDGHILSLKLADFGLAQKIHNELLYTLSGTPAYVAPEILSGKGYGVKIDIWAAGVMLYVLHCGFPPFDSNSQDRLFDKIAKGTYDFPEPYWNDVSEEAKNLITSMLQCNPSLRFSAKDVLDHPWCCMYDMK